MIAMGLSGGQTRPDPAMHRRNTCFTTRRRAGRSRTEQCGTRVGNAITAAAQRRLWPNRSRRSCLPALGC
jgi:hypothetical protein